MFFVDSYSITEAEIGIKVDKLVTCGVFGVVSAVFAKGKGTPLVPLEIVVSGNNINLFALLLE